MLQALPPAFNLHSNKSQVWFVGGKMRNIAFEQLFLQQSRKASYKVLLPVLP